jgi:hypothetical protein
MPLSAGRVLVADSASSTVARLVAAAHDTSVVVTTAYQAILKALGLASSVSVFYFDHVSSFLWLSDWRIVIAVGVVVALGSAVIHSRGHLGGPRCDLGGLVARRRFVIEQAIDKRRRRRWFSLDLGSHAFAFLFRNSVTFVAACAFREHLRQ